MRSILNKEDRIQVALGTKTLYHVAVEYETMYTLKSFEDIDEQAFAWHDLHTVVSAGINPEQAAYKVVKYFFVLHQQKVDNGMPVRYDVAEPNSPSHTWIDRNDIVTTPNPLYYFGGDNVRCRTDREEVKIFKIDLS